MNIADNGFMELVAEHRALLDDPVVVAMAHCVPFGFTKSIGDAFIESKLGPGITYDEAVADLKEMLSDYNAESSASNIADATRASNIEVIIAAIKDKYPDCVVDVDVNFDYLNSSVLLDAALAVGSGNMDRCLKLLDLCTEFSEAPTPQPSESTTFEKPLDHQLRKESSDTNED